MLHLHRRTENRRERKLAQGRISIGGSGGGELYRLRVRELDLRPVFCEAEDV
jgi:hypothetical protein